MDEFTDIVKRNIGQHKISAGFEEITESTDAITDAAIIMTPVLQSKDGEPHWKGYGTRNQEDLERA